MNKFFDVFCIKCGNKTTADKMAIDVGRIIKDGIKAIIDEPFNFDADIENLKTMYEALEVIDLGIYLTAYELSRNYLDTDYKLKFTGRDVLKLIEEKYEIQFKNFNSNEKKSTEEDGNEDDIKNENVGYAEFSTRSSLGEKMNSKFDFIDSNDDNIGYLTRYMRTNNSESDEENKKKRIKIETLLEAFHQEADNEIVVCVLEFDNRTDDNGNDFVGEINVIYNRSTSVRHSRMVCKDCGEEYHQEAGKHKEHVVVLLGSARTGKTAYLAALIETIEIESNKNKSKDNSKIELNTAYENEQYQSFKNHELKQYKQGQKVTKTDTSGIPRSVFSMKIKIDNKEVIFMFIDLPGEVVVPSQSSENKMNSKDTKLSENTYTLEERKICKAASVFWLCLDPNQIDVRLEKELHKDNRKDSVEKDLNHVMTHIRKSILEIDKEGRATGKTSVPTAVMITKSDLAIDNSNNVKYFDYKSEYKDEYQMLSCIVDGRFDAKEFHARLNQTQKYLNDNNVKNLRTNIEDIFNIYNYFSVAAYGTEVTEEKMAKDKLKPYGVLLPFTWTLTMLGYYDVIEVVRETKRRGFINKAEVTSVKVFEKERDYIIA